MHIYQSKCAYLSDGWIDMLLILCFCWFIYVNIHWVGSLSVITGRPIICHYYYIIYYYNVVTVLIIMITVVTAAITAVFTIIIRRSTITITIISIPVTIIAMIPTNTIKFLIPNYIFAILCSVILFWFLTLSS